jgi:hypothetical protein
MRKEKSLLAILVAYTGIYVCLSILFYFFGRPFIAGIYQGQSLPFLNILISHQSTHPLNYYFIKCIRLWVFAYFIGCAAITSFRQPQKLCARLSAHFSLFAALVFAAYGFYVLFLFWNPGFFTQPVTQDDYIHHYVFGLSEAEYLRHFFTPWGYDPFQNAGWVNYGIDNFWGALFFVLLGWIHQTALIFNCAVVLAYILPLFLVFLTARVMQLDKTGQFVLLILSAFLLTGFAELRNFYRLGVYGFILSTYFALFIWSLVYRSIHGERPALFIWAVGVAGFACWIHPLTGLTILILVLPSLAGVRKQLTVRRCLFLGAGALVVVCANLPWMLPLLHQKMFFKMATPLMQTGPGYFFYILRSDRGFDLLFILVLVFIFRTIRNKNLLYFEIIVSALIMAVMAFCGTQIGLSSAEPSRYLVPLGILIVFAAALIAGNELAERNLIYYGALALLSLVLITPPIPLRFGYPADSSADRLISFVKRSVPKTGRVLVQESLQYTYFDTSSHFVVALPVYTGREICANLGPSPGMLYPRFFENELFGRQLEIMPDTMLRSYLNLYAVSHVMVYSPEARQYFSASRLFRNVFSEKPFTVFEYLSRDTGRCFNCSAEVRSAQGKLFVSNAQGPSVVLKYHYFPFLKVKPAGLKIEPAMLMDDPVPFIRVDNGTVRDFIVQQ